MTDDGESTGMTPAQRVGTADPSLLSAGIVTIQDVETVYACAAYENQHRQRVPVLRRLGQRAVALREE